MIGQAVMSQLITNVGYTPTSVPESIRDLLYGDAEMARASLLRSGIEIDETSSADTMLLVAYASWLFNKRRTGEAKPPMLTAEIRDRQVARATGGREDGS